MRKLEPGRWWLPLGLLFLSALGGGIIWLRLQLAIERCADAGGKWASSDRRCTFVEPEDRPPLLARPANTLEHAD